ncbi:jg23981, partial [Pararge aegeria aegeria]
KTFRPYLYGHKFTIVTDHRPLKWLFNCKEPGSKLVRWRLKLEEFDYEVMYKKGKINSNADTLSRYPVNPIIEENSDPQPSTSGFPNDHPTLETETPADILDDLIDLGDLNISPLQNPNIDFSPLNLPSPSDPLVLPGDIPPNPVSPPDIPTVIEKETSEIPTQSNSPTHSNRDYSEFLKSSTKPNETCNTYIKEHNESLLKSTVKTIIIPTSIDYDESNPYVQDIIASTGDFFLNDERELHSFKKIDANRKTYYFLFTKVYYFDTSTYPDIFKALKSVRDDIMLTGDINEIAIHDFKNPFEQNSFVKIYTMLMYLFNNTNITINIHHNTIIYLTPSEVAKVLKENHDIPIAGHLGSNRMYDRIKERYYWKGMRSEIEDYVKHCGLCQSNKALRKINRSPMQITTSSTRPFERISLDIVGPLPEAGQLNLRYILTLQDDLTKFSIAYPISNATAEESCECLVHFITLFGIPRSVLTDQGTNFTADLFKRTC